MNEAYIVYVKNNGSGYIAAVNSSAFLADTTDWTKIGEGNGDRYHHAQGNYFPESIITEGGAYRYKLVAGSPVECTEEEIAQQEAANQSTPAAETDVYDELAAAIREGVDSV